MFSLSPSRDEFWPPVEWLVPSRAAGSHGRVPAHEDAQEDPGTPVVRVLCYLRQDGAAHLHGKRCNVLNLVQYAGLEYASLFVSRVQCSTKDFKGILVTLCTSMSPCMFVYSHLFHATN